MAVITKPYDATDDRDAAVPILATRVDANFDTLYTAVNLKLDADGTVTAGANQPMGEFKHTGVGNATARTEYASAGQVQDGGLHYATASGTNTITFSLSPAITAYAEKQLFWFKAAATNTDVVTVNVNSVGAKDITKNGTQSLSPGDLISGGIYGIVYDGTRFQLVNPSTYAKYNNQTGTTYKVTAADNGKIITLSNGSAITVTLPQQSDTTLPQGFWCIFRWIGVGQPTFVIQGSDTLRSIDSANKLRVAGSEARADLEIGGSPNTWALFGDIVA